MTGYYKKPAEAGKLYPCKKCNKTPTVGQDRYYEKIEIDGPDGNKTEIWVGCVDFECFKSQGGSSEQAQQKKQFQSTKFKLEQAKSIMEMTEAMLKKFIETRQTANKNLPEHKLLTDKGYQVDEKYNNLTLNEQAVFIESIFRTLSQNFKT